MLTAPTPAQIESVVHDKIRAVLAERVGEVGPPVRQRKAQRNARPHLARPGVSRGRIGSGAWRRSICQARFDHQRPIGGGPRAGLSAGVLSGARSAAAEDDAIAAAVKRAQTRRARRERR